MNLFNQKYHIQTHMEKSEVLEGLYEKTIGKYI